jgi:hypothetical protein
MAKDILLTSDNDLQLLNGDFFIGESLMQEVGIILQMNQGELKIDPLIGANLIVKMRGIENRHKIESLIDSQMELDGKNYDEIKELIIIKIN